VSLVTTAELRLLGSSALRMTYRYSSIDERPVDPAPLEQSGLLSSRVFVYRVERGSQERGG
jgi:hypothetical protein